MARFLRRIIILTDIKCFYAIVICYNTTMAITKLTILLQYGRIIAVQNIRVTWIVVTFLIVGWSVSQVFWVIFFCIPVNKNWNPSIPGTCGSMKLAWYINSGSGLLTDLVVLVFPLPVICKLNMLVRQKVLIMGLFGLGFLYVQPPSHPFLRQPRTNQNCSFANHPQLARSLSLASA